MIRANASDDFHYIGIGETRCGSHGKTEKENTPRLGIQFWAGCSVSIDATTLYEESIRRANVHQIMRYMLLIPGGQTLFKICRESCALSR
jgi:hypothetical protein